MAKFDDALRGYAYEIMKRDSFVCRYCGLNGKLSFTNWLQMSEDHLLPKGHPLRNHPDYRVCACQFCNVCDNHYFERAEERGLRFHDLSPEALIEQRRPYVFRTRSLYESFWTEHVAGCEDPEEH